MNRILKHDLRPLSAVCPGIDPQLETMASKAMSAEADSRYQDLSEMQRELTAIRERVQASMPDRCLDLLHSNHRGQR